MVPYSDEWLEAMMGGGAARAFGGAGGGGGGVANSPVGPSSAASAKPVLSATERHLALWDAEPLPGAKK